MPHIAVHLTQNIAGLLDMDSMLEGCVRAVHDTAPEEFPLSGLRARAAVSSSWYAADGNPENATIHVELHLIAGRDAGLCKRVAEAVLDDLQARTGPAYAGKPLSLSVEFFEMERRNYFARNTFADFLGQR